MTRVRVAVDLDGPAEGFFGYLGRLAKPLADRGVTLVGPEAPHDLLFVNDARMVERFGEPDRVDRPLAVFERKDAAVVQPKLRRWLAHPRVRVWLKTTVFRDPALNNRPTATGHLHMDWIRQAEGEQDVPSRTPPVISDADLAKILAFHPVFMMEALEPARLLALEHAPRTPLSARSIDLLCAGLVDRSWPDLTRHRQRANAVASTLAGRTTLVGRGRVFEPAEFLTWLGRSRIMLSPLGHGEMNWKDWEAVMCETVVVKPSAAHVTTAMYDIYRPGGGVVECAYDFSDLELVVERILADLNTHQARAAAERKAMVACFAPDRLAEQFAAMVRNALQARPHA